MLPLIPLSKRPGRSRDGYPPWSFAYPQNLVITDPPCDTDETRNTLVNEPGYSHPMRWRRAQ